MTQDAVDENKSNQAQTSDGRPNETEQASDPTMGHTYEPETPTDDPLNAPTSGNDTEMVEPDVSVITAELEETKQQLLRAHADFDNFRRRTRQEKEDLQKFATKKLLADLLPVVDNFDRALAAPAVGDGQAELLTGLEMVRRQLLNVLEQHGVTPMQCQGQPFDPNQHEAVMQEPAGDGEPGVVCGELQKGYWLAGKVLRPAMVKVTV